MIVRIPGIRPLLGVAALLSLAGCRHDEPKPTPAGSSTTPSVSSNLPPQLKKWAPPSGPVLAILAGQGVGPIRIGATVATIQRHMQSPCDSKTPEVCRYYDHAIEFELKNGVTERIRIHRAGRAAGKDASGAEREFGFFNGAIPPDLRFGMVPQAITEVLGAPQSVERTEATPPNQTVERDHYPGMVIEYDRHTNGNLIMAGVVIERSNAEVAPSPSSSH